MLGAIGCCLPVMNASRLPVMKADRMAVASTWVGAVRVATVERPWIDRVLTRA